MEKPSQMVAFDALYQLAARDGRGAALFGDSAALVRDAYERTLIGDGYPDAYLEFPLMGRPCLDILVVHGEVHQGDRFAPGAGFGYQAMCDWFSRVCSSGNVSCGIELDTSVGETEQAGVYLQYRRRTELVEPFLDSVGEGDRAASYRAVLERMPDGWPPSYVGLFPGREGAPLRIGGYLDKTAQKTCATNPTSLARVFDQVGFGAYDDAMLEGKGVRGELRYASEPRAPACGETCVPEICRERVYVGSIEGLQRPIHEAADPHGAAWSVGKHSHVPGIPCLR